MSREERARARRPGGHSAGRRSLEAVHVAAIPGSQGLRDNKIDRGGASNVLFTDGDYSYVVGRFALRGRTGAKQVTNAAINLYNRLHGAAICPYL